MENNYLNETINLIEVCNANNLCLEQKENELKREIYENNRLKGNLSTYKNNIFFKIVNIIFATIELAGIVKYGFILKSSINVWFYLALFALSVYNNISSKSFKYNIRMKKITLDELIDSDEHIKELQVEIEKINVQLKQEKISSGNSEVIKTPLINYPARTEQNLDIEANNISEYGKSISLKNNSKRI